MAWAVQVLLNGMPEGGCASSEGAGDRKTDTEEMATVGIIANPAAGKDIRRLVAHGRFVPNHEKVNTLRRVLAGLAGAPVERVVMMPDTGMLCHSAAGGSQHGLETVMLDMVVDGREDDSTRAAGAMAEMGVSCIVTLGGDGTNRAVAKGSAGVPLVPISTGTNNVFPYMVEGTVAGLAAGVVASGKVDVGSVTTRSKLLQISIDGAGCDSALVDVAVSAVPFAGARAIWDMSTVHEVFLARAEPDGIGLSAIGARLETVGMDDGHGLHVRIGEPGVVVSAPVAPGVVEDVPVEGWSRIHPGERVKVGLEPCTIALDGERSIRVAQGQRAEVTLTLDGPPVVDVSAALASGSEAGLFTRRS